MDLLSKKRYEDNRFGKIALYSQQPHWAESALEALQLKYHALYMDYQRVLHRKQQQHVAIDCQQLRNENRLLRAQLDFHQRQAENPNWLTVVKR